MGGTGPRRPAGPPHPRPRPGPGRRPEGGRARRWPQAPAGPVFALSEAFGAWRVMDRAARLTYDLTPLQGEDIEADLGQRELTLNAMALPLGGGELLDPFGGRADLEATSLRLVSEEALRRRPAADPAAGPLRRRAGLRRRPRGRAADRAGRAAADRGRARADLGRAAPPGLRRRRAGRRWRWPSGPACWREVLPELAALHSVEQSHYHHLDVYDHTLEVLPGCWSSSATCDACSASSPRGGGGAGRAPGRRAHARPGAALRRAAPRRGQARHPRRAPGRPGHVHRPRRGRRRDGPRRSAGACGRARGWPRSSAR